MSPSTAVLVHGLARNLRSGARLALFVRVSPLDFRARAGDFAALFAFNLALMVVGGALRGGVPGRLNVDALPYALAPAPLLLLASLGVATLFARRDLLLLLATMLIAGDLVFEVAATALHLGYAQGPLGAMPLAATTLGYAYVGWAFAVMLRALWVATGGWRGRTTAQGAGVLAALFAFFLFGMPQAELWQRTPPAGPAVAQPSIADEQLFHRQQTLLAETLARVQAERPGVEDLYFVGVAPFSAQDVFVRELTRVRTLFDERFGTAGRSVALANSPATLATQPIATATNLRAVLEHVGGKMNPAEDVLFLFITSHGDQRHSLAFELPPLALNQLTPTALARMLQDSGIRWKVLVVSACYSGGYVEPLRDANTVVITAADDKSASFGCASGRDYTHFGRAFFDEALGRTFSFTEAFAAARASVAARERAERLDPSRPQIFVGAEIAAKLASIERRLAALR